MAFGPAASRHTGMGRQSALLLAVVLLLSGAMVARLAWLQLLHGAENRARADENRIRLLPRNPIRGRLWIVMVRCWPLAGSPTTSTSSRGRWVTPSGRPCEIAWRRWLAYLRPSWRRVEVVVPMRRDFG